MIDLTIHSGKSIALLGLGISGIATAAALIKGGASVFAWDDTDTARQCASDAGISVCDLRTLDFTTIDFLLISPGISTEHAIAQRALQNNIPLIGEVKLLCDALPNNTYIGITGTNGKSTTTALISHLLNIAGINHATGGNLGVPATALESLNNGVYVLEMSSYMLERLDGMKFNIGVFLNLSTDHLQRHKTMDGYLNAKAHLFDNMTSNDTAIIAMDDIYGQMMCDKVQNAKIQHVSCQDETQDYPYLSGQHNRQNIACLRRVADILNIENALVEKALSTFTGLAHRQEYVSSIDTVSFINDSKATNAESSAKALSAYKNIYWIAGGQEKGTYEDLTAHLGNITKAYLIGEGAHNIHAFLTTQGTDAVICHTMEKAVAQAYEDARKISHNTHVVLSPACASWDQYKSFEHRGDDFKRIIVGIKNQDIKNGK